MKVTLFDPAGDAAVLARLHATSFPDPWDAPAIAALLATPGSFAVWNDDGFVLARAVADEAEILTIAVLPAARNKGLGRALLAAAAGHSRQLGAASLFLEVSIGNPAALALYRGAGFAAVGTRKAYYGGMDALILRLSLPAKFA